MRLRNEMTREEVSVTISTESFVRVALLTAAAIVIFFSAKKAEHALVLILIAFFLSIALNAPVNWIGRHLPGKVKGSRALATTVSFLVVLIVLGTFLAMIVPPLVKQTDKFVKAAPHLIQEFRNQNSPIGTFIRKHHLQKEVTSVSKQLSSRLGNVGGTAFDTAKSITESVFSVVVIIVMTFMMLVEGPRWVTFFRRALPNKHHSVADRMATDMYAVIRGYVNGQVILAAIASIFIMPAVLLLHIGYPAGLVVVIFICALIPMIGHTIGAVIVTTVALFHSTTAAAIILAYYILYMQVENYIIQPKIQANTTNMSPLLVFMSVTIGVDFNGILGGLLAIPVAGCLRIAFLEYLRSKQVIDTKEFKEVTSVDTK